MGYTLDDHYVVEHNPIIKNPGLFPRIFMTDFFEAADRHNVETINELALVCWETGNGPGGFALLEQSLRIDLYNSDAYRLLGTAFFQQGRFADAVELLSRALTFDPDDQMARELLAQARGRMTGSKK